MKKLIFFALVLGTLMVCCKAEYEDVIPSDTVYMKADGPPPVKRISFDQGFDDEQRGGFWFTPQGARVLPYNFFSWLEQPDSEQLFRNTEHMSMLGYLPMDSSRMNPSGLPVGFAMTRAKSQEDAFVGFTCAACHTNQIDFPGPDGMEHYLIDGAPTLGNFVLFFDQLVDALNNTHKDPEKFERFAKNVLGDKYTVASAKEELKEELWKWAEGSAERQQVNLTSPHLPSDFTSYGRLDAFTNIENAGSAFGLNLLDNRNATNAPVSYPFLWGTHQSDFVQWNGSAPNKPRLIGPMIRNAGEVVGVFGGLEIKEPAGGDKPGSEKHTYISNIDFEGLGQLEGYVKILRAPKWDDANSNLPALDAVQVAMGAELYAAHCSNCHQVIPEDEQYDFYNAVMVSVEDIGTDPMTAWAAEHHTVSTGILEGSKAAIVAGDVFTDSTRAINIPVNGVVGSVLGNLKHFIDGVLITNGVKPTEDDLRKAMQEHVTLRDSMVGTRLDAHMIPSHKPTNTGTTLNLDSLKYKARPLNGIWATAPYLHNGSVPNLWALMLEPEERPTSFWVGSHRLDATNVGFVADRGKNEFRVTDQDGNIIMGNSNLGHDYGTTLTDEEKWALVEYMKSL